MCEWGRAHTKSFIQENSCYPLLGTEGYGWDGYVNISVVLEGEVLILNMVTLIFFFCTSTWNNRLWYLLDWHWSGNGFMVLLKQFGTCQLTSVIHLLLIKMLSLHLAVVVDYGFHSCLVKKTDQAFSCTFYKWGNWGLAGVHDKRGRKEKKAPDFWFLSQHSSYINYCLMANEF